MTTTTRARFIKEAILMIGIGVFTETEHGFFYINPDNGDVVWAKKDLTWWWHNGEYTEDPVSLVYAK